MAELLRYACGSTHGEELFLWTLNVAILTVKQAVVILHDHSFLLQIYFCLGKFFQALIAWEMQDSWWVSAWLFFSAETGWGLDRKSVV